MLKLNLRNHQVATTLIGMLVMLLALVTSRGTQELQQTILFSTLFVIGLLLTSYRQKLIVEPAKHLIHRKTGFGFLLLSKTISTQDLLRLTLRERVVRQNNTERTWYQILGKNEVICQLKHPLHARKIAEALAKALLLPLDNHIHGVRSLRSPHQLDLSVAARWRSAHLRKELPAPPASSRIAVTHSTSATRITLPAERENLKLLALFAIAILALGALLFSLSNEDDWLALVILFAPFVFMLVVAALAFSGRSAIHLTDSHITMRQGRSPFRKKLPLDSIEEFIKARDGIVLDSDAGSVWIHWAGSSEESHYLEVLLAYELARRQK